MYTIYILSQYTTLELPKTQPKPLLHSLWCKIPSLKYESKISRLEHRPRGPMDKASDFESEDCGFDPHRGQFCIEIEKMKFKNVVVYKTHQRCE